MPTSSIAAYLQGAGPVISILLFICLPRELFSSLTASLFVLFVFLLWKIVNLSQTWYCPLPGEADGCQVAKELEWGVFRIFLVRVLVCFVVNLRLLTELFGPMLKNLLTTGEMITSNDPFFKHRLSRKTFLQHWMSCLWYHKYSTNCDCQLINNKSQGAEN